MTMDKCNKSVTCTSCGKEHIFAMYVFAHWDEELIYKCKCGTKHAIKRGKIYESFEPANATKAQQGLQES